MLKTKWHKEKEKASQQKQEEAATAGVLSKNYQPTEM